MMLPITPQVLDGIEFGSIGRQALKLQPAVGANQKLFYQSAPMRRRTIPDHKQVPFDMGQKVFQKNNYLRTSDGSRKQLKVEIPPRYAGNRRECFPIEVILDNRRLTPWRPSPASVGTFTESALINKDYCSSLSFSVFFNCGHRRFFQRRIVSSSRSIARPTGRWQLQPSCFSTHQTCPLVYRMPNSRSMTCPTRAAVQNPCHTRIVPAQLSEPFGFAAVALR